MDSQKEKTQAEKSGSPPKMWDRWSTEAPVCIACGEVIPYHILFEGKWYCKKCSEWENQEYDYKKAMMTVWTWFENMLGIDLGAQPEIHMRLFNGRIGFFKKPVDTIRWFQKNKISCRRYMDRDELELHMIYACVKLWDRRYRKAVRQRMKRRGQPQGKALSEPQGESEYDTDAIAYWFQVQYLYMGNEREDAGSYQNYICGVRQAKGWDELIQKHPFIKERILLQDDIKKILEDNPISGKIKEKGGL